MKTLIRNAGQIVSGDIAAPLLDGDSIAIDNGTITAVGRALDVTGRAGEMREVGGNEWQHARRQERQHAGRERQCEAPRAGKRVNPAFGHSAIIADLEGALCNTDHKGSGQVHEIASGL